MIVETTGPEQANATAAAVRNLNNETERGVVSQTKSTTQINKTVTAVNKLQNAMFKGAVYAARFAGANSVLTNTLQSIALGVDVALGSFQALRALSAIMTAQKTAETVANTTAAVSATGPAAPVLGPAIVAAILGAGVALAAFLAQSAPSAAFGGIFDKPTYARVGDNPAGIPEAVLPISMLNGGGGGVYIDGSALDDSRIRLGRIRARQGFGMAGA